MVDRITLRKDSYIQVDGQWQIVLGGSVIDVPDAQKFHPDHVVTVQKNTGTLANGKAASTATFRTR